ncbi:hypothetical protein ACAF76_015435 [Brevibacillus sp. TJ4]|uniref:hypothetical protein n=1 Tax=Brevibacillus sp. TJ4 TaxID=3234853 RepID=UPI0037D41492
MVEQTLELRGISLTQLATYLRECAGQTDADAGSASEKITLPLCVNSGEWQAEMLREEVVTITSRFHVNAVFIRFTAADEAILSRVLDRFRIKVLRVGG